MTGRATEPRRPARAGPRSLVDLAALLAATWPLLAVAALYGTYVLAWIVLGHAPRPNLDDPKDVPVVREIRPAAYVALLGLLPAGLAALLLVLHLIVSRAVARRTGLLCLAAACGLWIGALVLLGADPLRVFAWFMD